MKQFLSLLAVAFCITLTGCFDTTSEITIAANGSGNVSTTTDMSAMIGLAKMGGQNEQLDEIKDKKIDTTMSLAPLADSMKSLTAEEKELVKKGTLGFNMSFADEKLIIKSAMPFNKIEQLSTVMGLSGRMLEAAAEKGMGKKGEGEAGAEDDEKMPALPFDEYYTLTFKKGSISRKLLADKVKDVDTNEAAQTMKQMSSFGLNAKNTFVIHLPSAAKKAEGKGVTLSEDKKTVTVVADAETFFDAPADLEFLIEY